MLIDRIQTVLQWLSPSTSSLASPNWSVNYDAVRKSTKKLTPGVDYIASEVGPQPLMSFPVRRPALLPQRAFLDEFKERCWNCGEVTHQAAKCRYPKRKACALCHTWDVDTDDCPVCLERSVSANIARLGE